MITINVKKNVFACLVIAIIFILSLYQYCENYPEKCFYLSVVETSLVGNYMQTNASKRISGHAIWLQNKQTTAVPTTIDTLKSLLRKSGRIKSPDENSVDNELKRIERVDMEEVQDEENDREEAKLTGIGRDGDNKSLGYREEDFLRREHAKEMSTTEAKRSQKRNWLELQHSLQNSGRYERVDKTILDPGSMTREDLKEFYHKSINSSSLLLIAVENRTKAYSRGMMSWNSSKEAKMNTTGGDLITKAFVARRRNDSVDGNGEVMQFNTVSNVRNGSKHTIGQKQGAPHEMNENEARNVRVMAENARNTNRSAISSRHTKSWGHLKSSDVAGEIASRTNDLQGGKRNAAKKYGYFNKRRESEHRTVNGSWMNNGVGYANERGVKVVMVNVTHDDDHHQSEDDGDEDARDESRDDGENEASSSVQSGEHDAEMSQGVSSDKSTKTALLDPSRRDDSIELTATKTNGVEDELAYDAMDHDDKYWKNKDKNATNSTNETQYISGKSNSGTAEDRSKRGEEFDELDDGSASVIRNGNGSRVKNYEGKGSIEYPDIDERSKDTSAMIKEELDNTDKIEEEEEKEEEESRNVINKKGSVPQAQGKHNTVNKNDINGRKGTFSNRTTKHNNAKENNSNSGFSFEHQKGKIRYHKKVGRAYLGNVTNGIATMNSAQSITVQSDEQRSKRVETGEKPVKSQSKLKDYRDPEQKTKPALTNRLMYHKGVSCKPLDPKLVLYNRIFKTGSTSINKYLKDEYKKRFFQLRIGTTEDWYKTGHSYPYPRTIEQFATKSLRRRVYTGHFFFRKTLDINRSHTYINQVREPLNRILSHYFYMRNSTARPKDRITEMKAAGEYNETLQECFAKQHRGCENNVMTHFLCGDEPFCKTGSEKAIQQAKYNMLHYYSAIGLTENLDLYLKILRKRLPKYFRLSRTLPMEKKSSKTEDFFSSVSEELKARIKQANFADYQIYEYAKYLFTKQLIACKIRTNS